MALAQRLKLGRLAHVHIHGLCTGGMACADAGRLAHVHIYGLCTGGMACADAERY